jgi:hypothetical protein
VSIPLTCTLICILLVLQRSLLSVCHQHAAPKIPANMKCLLHLNDNEIVTVTDNALHKFLPLLNIIKVTLREFTRVSSEVALNEASVVSRSSYGRSVIFFNPMKNCGKFNLHFYLLCCATTFACVRMKEVMKNNSDNPDPHQSMGAIYNTTIMSKLNKLVIEICKPLFGSNRMVNMNIFYTPPDVMILLKNHKV